jgi:hypothetical protein
MVQSITSLPKSLFKRGDPELSRRVSEKKEIERKDKGSRSMLGLLMERDLSCGEIGGT